MNINGTLSPTIPITCKKKLLGERINIVSGQHQLYISAIPKEGGDPYITYVGDTINIPDKLEIKMGKDGDNDKIIYGGKYSIYNGRNRVGGDIEILDKVELSFTDVDASGNVTDASGNVITVSAIIEIYLKLMCLQSVE